MSTLQFCSFLKQSLDVLHTGGLQVLTAGLEQHMSTVLTRTLLATLFQGTGTIWKGRSYC